MEDGKEEEHKVDEKASDERNRQEEEMRKKDEEGLLRIRRVEENTHSIEAEIKVLTSSFLIFICVLFPPALIFL